MQAETGQRIDVLDGWRGLAIASVLFAHFVTTDVVNLGRVGVELFFVLSGRLMADILFVRDTRLRTFFPRRFSRVYPALSVFCVVLFATAHLTGLFDIPWRVTLAGLLFCMNYAAMVTDVSAATDHLWSLAIEEHCYVLLGLLASLVRRVPRIPLMPVLVTLVAAAVLNGIVQTYALHRHYHYVYWRTDVRGASILISVVVYLLVRERVGRDLKSVHPLLPVLCASAGLALSLRDVPDPIKYSLGTLFFALAVNTLERVPAPVAGVLRGRVLTTLGVGSFSLYLWQQPCYTIGQPVLRYASLLGVAVVAWASYRWVEQPARHALNRWLTPHLRHAPRRGPALESAQP